MDRYRNKVVIVTGAAGQIGAACVEAMACEGARVGAIDLLDAPRPNRRVVAVRADFTSESEIERAFLEVERELGPVDVLVQSAAVIARLPFLEITAENIDRVFCVNVRAILLGGRIGAQSMIARDAQDCAIINLTSIGGVIGGGDAVAYQASKAAVTMATKSMAVALAPYGIRVNAVGPGSMAKPQELASRDPLELTDYERKRIPLGRHGVAREVVEAILFLASPAASFVTGSILYIDGGTLASF